TGIHLVGRAMMLKTRHINPSAILINFIGLYGVAILTVIIPETFGVRRRGFYCDDTSIQQPFYDHTIPMGQLTWASLALFLGIALITEFVVSRKESSGVVYQWRGYGIPAFVVQALLIFGYSHIGFVLQVALTQYAKYGTGRLRPHFMDICKPIGFACTEPHQYITHYTCSNTNARRVYETRLSFFSGHSSTAIYSALFIAIYLESRLVPRNLLTGVRRAVQGTLIAAALIVCFTRVTDNFHHPTDVLVGIAFGGVVAMVTASSVAGLCSYGLNPVRQPKGISAFSSFISRNEEKQ
ncbi:hypothetical protein PENTCL1PPCAC_14870, partial [Pristionchus entomophagus]